MTDRTALHLRAIRRAAELAGGPAPLAKYLGLPITKLTMMLSGLSPVPDSVFAKVVDLVIARNINELVDQMNAARGGSKQARRRAGSAP